MIEEEDPVILATLRKQPTIVGKSLRAVGSLALFMGAISTAFSVYAYSQAERVSKNIRVYTNSLKQASDSAQNIITHLQSASSLDDNIIYRITEVDSSLTALESRIHEKVTPQAAHTEVRNPCGKTIEDDRSSYTALKNSCVLTVTIPHGGSLSGAAKIYFGDMYRWREDWERNANAIGTPNRVEPGTHYTFNLR